MNRSVSCLTPKRLRQLSDNELSPPELEKLEEHVTHCETCRCAMEEAAAEPDWRQKVRDVLADESGPAVWSASADSSAEDGPHDGYGAVEQFRKLLGPTDDPRMLGRIGPYEIVGILGRGGMGVVFKGFDGALNRYVAIKMLLPHLAASGAARKRFAREAQAAAAVVHDHVMAIHSVAEWQGVPYLVMPYGRGVSLQKRLNDKGPLEVREILRIGMQTAAGLAAAHAQGLVHRDVKPANILLAEDVERVTLTDFGLARAVDDASLTRVGVLAGTPQYMSPEQARGKAVDARSDLFSFGSVLYAMCTGRAPFRADSSHGVLRLILDDEPTPIREINPEIPEWLCAIMTRLLAKRPDDRFSSASEVAELLESCLAHVQQPTVVALPSSLSLPRAVPVTRFHKHFFTGVLVMIATLALGLVAMFAFQGGSPPRIPDDSLKGVWEVVLPSDIAAKRPEDQRLRLVFTDDWQGTFRGDQRVSASRLKIEPQHTPKRLSFVDGEGKSMRGIYEVNEDGLRLSIASDTSPMPTKFGTEDPEFKRVKGELAEEQFDALKLYSKQATTTDANKDVIGGVYNAQASNNANAEDKPQTGSVTTTQGPGTGGIELIALAKYPSRGSAWWTPDGRLLPEPAVDPKEVDLRSGIDPKHAWYTAVFRIPGGLDSEINSDRIRGTQSPWFWLGRQFRNSNRVDDLEALAIALPANATQADLTIEVAQGNWRTVATVEGKRFLEEDSISESGTEWRAMDREDGRIRLFVDYPQSNVQSRVAFRRDREITFANSTYGASPNDGKARNEAKFSSVELARGEFILQTRPFKKVEFHKVDLQNHSKPAKTSQRIKHFPTGSRNVKRIAYSADGKLIAIANDNSTLPFNGDWKRGAQILEAETGKTVVSLQLTTMNEFVVLAAAQGVRESKVESIAFSPDENVVAVGTSIGQVKLFNSATGELLQSLEDEKAKLPENGTPETLKKSIPITRAMGSVASLAFSPDGGLLATCGSSLDDAPLFPDGADRSKFLVTGPGRLKVWDVKTGTLKLDLIGHSQANAVTFSHDGNMMASAGSWKNDNEEVAGVILWNPRDGTKIRAITNGGTQSVAFSPNSKLVAICSQRFDKKSNASTGVVSVADVGSGVFEWQHTVAGWAKPVAFSPDGKNVVVLCGGHQSLRFLDTKTGAVRHDIKAVAYPQYARWNDFAIALNGSSLAIGGSDKLRNGSVELWDFSGLDTTATFAPATQTDSLEGVWELVAQKGPEEQRLRLVFAGGWYATMRGSQRVSISRLKVEPQHTPKRLSLIDGDDKPIRANYEVKRDDGSTATFSRKMPRKPMHGIYEVDGDDLRLNLAADTLALPTKFGTEAPEYQRVTGQLAQEQFDALNEFSRFEGDLEFSLNKELRYRTKACSEWQPVSLAGASELLRDGQKVVIHANEDVHNEWAKEIVKMTSQRKDVTVTIVPPGAATGNTGRKSDDQPVAKPEDPVPTHPKCDAAADSSPIAAGDAVNGQNETRTAQIGWGLATNGLRARVVPVLSSMSEDATDPAQRMATFAKAEDVAFVVEMENVSDKPIKLLDTRYGESYGESKGKAKSDWFGQFLFSIDLLNADGEKIEQPEVQVVDLDGVLGGAMVASLEPGKSHRFLLRPAKWLSAMTQRIEPGRYRAAVTYHGLPARVVTRIKEYRPDSAVLAAVEGAIVSSQVSFEVLPPSPPVKPNDANADDTTLSTRAWGEPSNGLRAAIEFLPRQHSYAHGEKLEVKLHVQNYSKKPITLSSHLWLSELKATVKNDQGDPVDVSSVWYTGRTLSARVILKPRQVIVFDAGNVGLAITKERADKFEHITNRKLIAPAGRYSMQLEGRFGHSFLLKDGKDKVLAPLEGDWIGELQTGAAPLTITEEVLKTSTTQSTK